MLTAKSLEEHMEITTEAPKWIPESCWLVLFNEEMANPCEKVTTNKSSKDELRHWFDIGLFFIESLEQLIDVSSPETNATASAYEMEQLGQWLRVLGKIEWIELMEALEIVHLKVFAFLSI